MHVRGVPVQVNASWLLIAGLIAYTYGARMQATIPALREGPTWVVVAAAAASAVLFFGSVLAHELGHALVSQARGVPVRSITMFLLGGVTESESEARTARDELAIVGVGPFTSLVLAAALGLVATALAGVPAVAAVLGYMGWTNLALAVFNVLPGYPMDGGRLLRSVIWMLTGRPHLATRIAARTGQVFAWLLIVGGLVELLGVPAGMPQPLRLPLFVLSLTGLWGGLIGIFLLRGASQAHASASARDRLAQQRVRDVMGSVPPTLPADAPISSVVDVIQQRPSLPWPVGAPPVGVVRLVDLDAVPADEWETTPIRAVAAAVDGGSVHPDADLDSAVAAMLRAPHRQLLVVADGEPVGLLTESLVVVATR